MQSLWMIAASLLFACMGVCVKLGSERFTTGELVFYRGFIATLFIGGFIYWRGLSIRTSHLRAHLKRSLAGFGALVCYFFAISMIPLATAVTLSYTSPLFLALLLVFWLREAQGLRVHLALAVGFFGVVLLLQPSLNEHQWFGALLGLASGMSASIAFLNVRRLGELGEPEWRTVFYFSLFSSIGGLPWVITSDPWHAIDASGWLLLVGVGGFGVCAQWCMTMAYSRGRTLATAGLTYTTVVFASLFGILIWGEVLPPLAWFGIALVIAASIATTLLSARRRPLPASR